MRAPLASDRRPISTCRFTDLRELRTRLRFVPFGQLRPMQRSVMLVPVRKPLATSVRFSVRLPARAHVPVTDPVSGGGGARRVSPVSLAFLSVAFFAPG